MVQAQDGKSKRRDQQSRITRFDLEQSSRVGLSNDLSEKRHAQSLGRSPQIFVQSS